ncbi:hypothetical protein [Deinococcus wulumuqiensis]|uniref:hypothetical protein n=1 Tax=Deinococcus wulumuqiensis TaxID=980427 RepID=UPI0013C37A7D|nr:hypothetical protein [Deinococcus wulumuqiensis]
MKSKLMPIISLCLLASCGQNSGYNNPQQQIATITPNPSLAPLSTDVAVYDFDDALANLSRQYPNFAGYSLDMDGSVTLRLVKHGGDLPGQRVGQIAKAIKDLLNTSSEAPVLFNEMGARVPVKRVKPEFITVDQGFANLYAWKLGFRKDVLRTGIADELYIDQARNKVVLSVANESKLTQLKNWVRSAGIPDTAVDISVAPIVAEKPLTGLFRPPLGGVDINNDCTLGTNVRYNGFINGTQSPQGFLTAAHCTPTIGAKDSNFAIQQGGYTVGYEQLDPPLRPATDSICANDTTGKPYECRFSDVAFATYNIVSNVGRIARPTEFNNNLDVPTVNGEDAYYTVKDTVGRPAVDTIVTKIGHTTGFTKGKVVASQVDFNVSNPSSGQTYTVIGGVKVYRLSDTYTLSDGGDSGGPWFIRSATASDTNVTLVGFHTSGDGDGPGTYAHFSAIAGVQKDFGTATFQFCITPNTPSCY